MTELEKITEQLKKWNPHNYHTIYVDGQEYKGMRDPMYRLNKIFLLPQIYRILDLGCNMGGLLWPWRLYYPEAIGVDKSEVHIEFCKNLAKVYGIEYKARFLNYDLEKSIQELNYLGKFGIIFMLSMTQHLKNWQEVILWAHKHCELLFIEFNGQPTQVEEYITYMKTLRSGLEYICEENNRYLYLSYNPIRFKFDGKIYDTYFYNRGTNVETFCSLKENAIIKIYKNKQYENEVKWCEKLSCAPDIYYIDRNRDVIIQELCGMFLSYFNTPDNYLDQIRDIKTELLKNRCSAEDAEMHVKDGRIKLVDLGACYEYDEIRPRITNDLELIRFRRKQYLAGDVITIMNVNKI